MTTAPEVSVVIPTFNEAENIAQVAAELATALGELRWEIIVVDDDSPDGTAARVKQMAQTDARIRCIRRVNRRGLAGACIEGMLSSAAPYLVVMDGDLQHDPSILPKIIALLRAGQTDLVIGSRLVSGGSIGIGLTAGRATLSSFGAWMARIAIHTDISDILSGFFAIRREAFDEIAPRLLPSGFKLLADIVASAGGKLRYTEVAYDFRPRGSGDSKLSIKVTIELVALLIERATRGVFSSRFILFSCVGASGIALHLAVLWLAQTMSDVGFTLAQAGATFIAMTWNFFLNNWITFSFNRLTGFARPARGLAEFWLLCAAGAIANIGVATWIYDFLPVWWIAGSAGLLVGAVWNYNLTSSFVWSKASG
jgi:dolichol-phosphate mannosyltransferase